MTRPPDQASTEAAWSVKTSTWLAVLGAIGLASQAVALAAIHGYQFRIADYRTVLSLPSGSYPFATAFAAVLTAALVVVALLPRGGEARAARWKWAAGRLWPLLLSAPLAATIVTSRPPPFAFSLLMVGATAWAAARAADGIELAPGSARAHRFVVALLLSLVALATVVHTRIEINFYEHFMLGHADIGHFTEELKNVLAGRGLRCDSFENTRFGWHFGPLMLILVPGYAFWPSPVYLMTIGPLILHVAALPAYFLSRRLSGSVWTGLAVALAWLLLPSVSRLVYGNTYGFQWNNTTAPLISLMLAAAFSGRWRASIVFVALLLLCRETAAAAALGWAVYLALFTDRRRMGIAIGAVAIAYFLLCANVIIPYFAVAERFERLDIFGTLGGSVGDLVMAVFRNPGEVWDRLIRVEGAYFLLLILASMACLPIARWRLCVAALPTLLPLWLVENPEWMGIKFWHHATVLPFLFFAALLTVQPPRSANPPYGECRPCGRAFPPAMALLFGSAMSHYLFGFSPVAKAYEPYAADSFLQQPDPRLAFVTELRARISPDRAILATERVAAHFTDYRRLYTARRKGAVEAADFVIMDRSDSWDTSGLPQRADDFAADPRFGLLAESGPILVLARRPDAPATPLD